LSDRPLESILSERIERSSFRKYVTWQNKSHIHISIITDEIGKYVTYILQIGKHSLNRETIIPDPTHLKFLLKNK